MRFGTNCIDTLNLLYLELLRFSVKFGKRWSGPNFEVRLGLLFSSSNCTGISVPTILRELDESR